MFHGAEMENSFDLSHWTGHAVSVGAIIATAIGWLPVIAALVAVVWYVIQIYESNTCQKFLDKRRRIHKARRVAKLRAKQKVLLAELEGLEVMRVARDVAADKLAAAASEAATLLVNQQTHEKIHDGGAVIKSTPPA